MLAVAGTAAALAISTTPAWAGHNGNGHGNGNPHSTATPAASSPTPAPQVQQNSAPSTASGAGNNQGDAWVDNLGRPQVGHENDPHLACTTIAIWGDKLNDASGPFTIQGWPPSGTRETDWSATWQYDTAAGGSQVIATVPAQDLVAAARRMGDSPQPQQGFHFKLDLEDPRTGASVGDDKYKVFWVSCGVSPAVATTTPTPTPTPTPSSATTPTPAPVSGVLGVSTTTPAGGVGGATAATPLTGAALPFELAGSLLVAGSGLLLLGSGLRRRR